MGMLVVTRKIDEDLVIGECVTVKVLKVNGDKVRLGVSGPREVNVRRGELPFRLHLSEKGNSGDEASDGDIAGNSDKEQIDGADSDRQTAGGAGSCGRCDGRAGGDDTASADGAGQQHS